MYRITPVLLLLVLATPIQAASFSAYKEVHIDNILLTPSKYNKKASKISVPFLGESQPQGKAAKQSFNNSKYYHLAINLNRQDRSRFAIIANRKNTKVMKQIMELKRGTSISCFGAIRVKSIKGINFTYLDLQGVFSNDELAEKLGEDNSYTEMKPDVFLKVMRQAVDEKVSLPLTYKYDPKKPGINNALGNYKNNRTWRNIKGALGQGSFPIRVKELPKEVAIAVKLTPEAKQIIADATQDTDIILKGRLQLIGKQKTPCLIADTIEIPVKEN